MSRKENKLFLTTFLVTIVAFLGIAISFGFHNNTEKLKASINYSDYTNKIIYFDLETFTNSLPSSTEEYDYMKVAFALQGLINREQPVLYYNYKSNGFPFLNTNIDLVWLSDLQQSGLLLDGYTIETYTSFDQIIDLANDLGVVNGVVLWDPNVPATANVASTIAGVENLVPIRKDVTSFSCYTDLVINRQAFGSVQRDLTGKFTGSGYLPDANLNVQNSGTASTGSAKNDAYRWAKKYYLDTKKTSSELMGYTRDSWIKPCSTGACFVDSYLPTTMAPGEEKQVYVTILNNNVNSGEVWTNAGNYRIASNSGNGGHNDFTVTAAQYGFEQGDLAYGVRIYIDPDNDISVGERQRITFTIKAPDTAGTYRLNLGFVHDGAGWFNGTLDQTITVSTTSSNRKQEHYGTYPLGIFNAGLNTSDYLIQKKAFFFDLSPDPDIAPLDDRGQVQGTDVATLELLLAQQQINANNNIFTVIGFVPWFVKYTTHDDPLSRLDDVPAEWKMIDTISKYGGESDADAISPVGLTNASVFSHETLKTPFVQNNDKEAIMNGDVVKEKYDSNTKYYILYMGDYDCGAWTSGVLPSRFLLEYGQTDKYPLTWPVDADLSQRVPQAFNWIYAHQNRNDYFVAGDNGTGYLNPMQLASSNTTLTTWKNHNIEMNNAFDLDITGFLIGGNNTISTAVKNAYQEMTPVMVGYQGTLASGSTTTPFIPSANISPNTTQLAQDIYNQVNATSSQYIIIRTIQTTRAQAYAAIDQVNTLSGGRFKVVDPYTMAYLKKNTPSKYKGCYTDGTNYQWINATTIPSGYTYVNTVSSSEDCHKPRTKISKPTMTTSIYTYTGNTITPTVANYDATTMTRSGTESATNVDNYSITYEITDKTNYEWTDGTQDNVTLNWSITKLLLEKPVINGPSSFTYTGSSQSVTVDNFVSSRMTKTGTTSKTNVGNYSATYSLKDTTNTNWVDGTTTDVTLNWSITPAQLTKPTINGSSTFTYDGNSHSISFDNYDETTMNISNSSNTDAGSYSSTISLKNTSNYEWTDGTNSAIVYTWSIEKANLSLVLEMNDYYENSTPSTPVLTGNVGNGTVTYTYSPRNESSYTSNVPTTKGDYTIKATVSSTNNFNGGTATANFKVLESSIVLPTGSIITDVGVYASTIDSYNAEKGTNYDYTHLFTEQELASLETLVIRNNHNLSINSLNDLSYFTSLENLSIYLDEDNSISSLDLSNNTALKSLIVDNIELSNELNLKNNTNLETLDITNSTIDKINIAGLNLNSINVDKPSQVGFIKVQKGLDVSYFSYESHQDENINNNSFGIICNKYDLSINESTTCYIKGKTTQTISGISFKMIKDNENISISNIQKLTNLDEVDPTKKYLYFGQQEAGEFDILSFTVTAISSGSSTISLTDYDNDNPIGYLEYNTDDYLEFNDNVSRTFYINKYKITDSSSNEITSGVLKTNYILKVVNGLGTYDSAYNIVVLGDVKADGIINIQDAAKAYKALSIHNYSTFNNTEIEALDANNDGLKNGSDIIKICNMIN